MARSLSRLDLSAFVLSGIDERVRRRILAGSEKRKLRPRTVLFKEGSLATHLHVVLSGTAELFGSMGEKESTLALMSPGDCFILAAVVRNAPTLMSARTVEGSEVLFVPAEIFRWAMHNDPVLAVNVSMELGKSFRSMVKQLRDHKLRTTRQRLAAYLLRLARLQSQPHPIELPVNKRLLSSLLGVEPESLSRAFVELRAFGVVTQRKHVQISDLPRLEQLASCDWAVDDLRG